MICDFAGKWKGKKNSNSIDLFEKNKIELFVSVSDDSLHES